MIMIYIFALFFGFIASSSLFKDDKGVFQYSPDNGNLIFNEFRLLLILEQMRGKMVVISSLNGRKTRRF